MPDIIVHQSIWIVIVLTVLLAIGLAWRGRRVLSVPHARRRWPRRSVLQNRSVAWLFFASGSVKIAGLVKDISRQGLCLVMEDMLTELPEECEVDVLLDTDHTSGAPSSLRHGTVRWTSGNRIGIMLDDLLAPESFLSGRRLELDSAPA